MFAWLIQDWDLFGPTVISLLSLSATLALLGIPVVAREQVLLGAGLVQAGTFGVALGVFLGFITNTHGTGPEPVIAAALAIMAASLLAARPPKRERPDAVAGWLYLAGGGGAILLVSGKPLAMEALVRIQSSSALGAMWSDAIIGGIVLLGTLAGAILAGRRILLAVWDQDLARSLGQRPILWNTVLAAWTGLVMAISLGTIGALSTTAMLVLPALIARRVVPSLVWMAPVAVTLALLATTAGLEISARRELPPAQVPVAILAGLLMAIWLIQVLWNTFAPARRAA